MNKSVYFLALCMNMGGGSILAGPADGPVRVNNLKSPSVARGSNCSRVIGNRNRDVIADVNAAIESKDPVRLYYLLKTIEPNDFMVKDDLGNTFLHSFVLSCSGGMGEDSTLELLLRKHKECTKDGFLPIDETNKQGQTALHIAVDRNLYSIAKMLIEQRANLRIKTKEGETPLTLAVPDKLGITDLIINANKNTVLDEDSCLSSPLHKALIYNLSTYRQKEFVKKIVDAAECIGKTKEVLDRTDKFGRTALWLAVARNSNIVARLLVDAGANINIPDKNRITPLFKAVLNQNEEIVRLLVGKVPDINIKDGSNFSLLHWAAIIESPKVALGIMGLLCSGGINVNITDDNEQTPLHIAAMFGRKEIVEFLISKGANPDLVDNEGMTPLGVAKLFGQAAVAAILSKRTSKLSESFTIKSIHDAVLAGNLPEVQRFLNSRSGSVNQKNKNGMTPLHLAAMCSSKEMVGLLIRKGADRRIGDAFGYKPVYWTLNNWKGAASKDVLSFLVGKEDDFRTFVNAGLNSPLHFAVIRNIKDAVRFFVEQCPGKGAMELGDSYAQTPIFWAAIYGYKEIATYLKGKGTDFNRLNRYGETLRDLAEENGHDEMVELFPILDWVAKPIRNCNW